MVAIFPIVALGPATKFPQKRVSYKQVFEWLFQLELEGANQKFENGLKLKWYEILLWWTVQLQGIKRLYEFWMIHMTPTFNYCMRYKSRNDSNSYQLIFAMWRPNQSGST